MDDLGDMFGQKGPQFRYRPTLLHLMCAAHGLCSTLALCFDRVLPPPEPPAGATPGDPLPLVSRARSVGGSARVLQTPTPYRSMPKEFVIHTHGLKHTSTHTHTHGPWPVQCFSTAPSA